MKSAIKNEVVRETINGVLDLFKGPEGLSTIRKTFFTRSGVPSDSWSFLNRIIMVSHGTDDARSFNAWQGVNRQVTKGSKGIKIVAPCIVQKENKKTGKKEPVLCGFRFTNVFAVEGTDGKPVDYKAQPMPTFKGEEIAKEFGIKITQGFKNGSYLAYYNPADAEIKMATPDQQTFFHELAHAIDDKIVKKLKTGQLDDQEIVAEFSSTVLMSLFGLGTPTKNSYDYIARYAKEHDSDPVDAVIPLLSRISKIVEYVFDRA